MRVLVLQHIACEPPGEFEDVLRERGTEILRVELDEGGRLPARDEFDAIVAMGGPMSVNDEAEHPWLVEEKALIRDAVRDGVPYWGSCLGVQLLAASLGARVYAGPRPEVGVLPVMLTDEGAADPVLQGLPREFPTLQWHGDTFDLPASGVRLAGSSLVANQAFRAGDRAYGVQFHLEVTGEMARRWGEVPAYRRSLAETLGAEAGRAFLADVERRSGELHPAARRLFANWLDLAAV
jgi:GMP synthase (glutamine-hydrolysing)